MKRRDLIRFNPFIGSYLTIQQGEYYKIAREDLHLIGNPDSYQLVNLHTSPPNAFAMPLKVQIQTTKHCNLRCITCAVAKKNRKDVMKNIDIKRLLEYLSRYGVLNIEWSGG